MECGCVGNVLPLTPSDSTFSLCVLSAVQMQQHKARVRSAGVSGPRRVLPAPLASNAAAQQPTAASLAEAQAVGKENASSPAEAASPRKRVSFAQASPSKPSRRASTGAVPSAAAAAGGGSGRGYALGRPKHFAETVGGDHPIGRLVMGGLTNPLLNPDAAFVPPPLLQGLWRLAKHSVA